jgi:hypothetical protein
MTRFTAADVERAHAEWRCSCGPAALAAICDLTRHPACEWAMARHACDRGRAPRTGEFHRVINRPGSSTMSWHVVEAKQYDLEMRANTEAVR